MLNVMITSIKVLLIGLWGVAVLGMFSMSPLPIEYQFYVLPLVGIVLFAHLAEYFALKAKVVAKTKTEMSFIQTMLWGFGYWLPLFNNK